MLRAAALLMLAVACRAQAVATCDNTYSAELPCITNTTCAWCVDADPTAKASCKSTSEAAVLPSSYTCGNGTRLDCPDVAKDQASCSKEVACYWCTSRTVGPICASWQQQKGLPKSVFTCEGPYPL